MQTTGVGYLTVRFLCQQSRLSKLTGHSIQLSLLLLVRQRGGLERLALIPQRQLYRLPLVLVLSSKAISKVVTQHKHSYASTFQVLTLCINDVPSPGQERLVLVVSERQSVEQLGFLSLSL